MKFSNTQTLRDKEVINLFDGSRLGCPEDFEFDVCGGQIIALIVVCESGFLGLGKQNEYIIPWEKIHCIGDDAILVRLDEKELQCCLRNHGKKKNCTVQNVKKM